MGTSDSPSCVTDPVREKELIDEFKRRLAYVRFSFLTAQKSLASNVEFNSSLARLARTIGQPTEPVSKKSRLHPELELVISFHARRYAVERGGSIATVTQPDVQKAAQYAVRTLHTRKGARNHSVLRYHVEGLMALLQETSGKPVLASRTRRGDYDPHVAEGISRILPDFFAEYAVGVPEAKIARMILDARKAFAGRPMRFIDYFPGYGLAASPDGLHRSAAHGIAIHIETAFAIYCPN